MYLDSHMLVQCASVWYARDFRLRVNWQKMSVPACAHAIRAILNVGTVRASIKFKSSCTVYAYHNIHVKLNKHITYSNYTHM